jgi:cytochrome c nitrite reductase small subunit
VKTHKLLAVISVLAFVVALGFFLYVLDISKATSYLAGKSENCINCHVMNTQYATWEHSSHSKVACVKCHLPWDGVQKYVSEARDGIKHGWAFTFNTFDNAIRISDDAARRVQDNCIKCHASLTSVMVAQADANHNYGDPTVKTGRRCWECHKEVPHGKVRGLSTTPNALGVRF